MVSGGGPLYRALLDKTLTVCGNSFVHPDLALQDIWGVLGLYPGSGANANPKKIGPAKAGPLFYINIVCKAAHKPRSVLKPGASPVGMSAPVLQRNATTSSRQFTDWPATIF